MNERVRSLKIENFPMPRKFRSYDPEQQLLLPPDLSDWVPEKHLARFISEVVDLIDMKPFYKVYEGALGQPPYHPALMLKVVLYSFSRGIFSSRKIESATYDDIGTRFLATDQHPDYSSFCNFRLRHSKSIHSAFLQVVLMCREAGLCSLGHVAIDGTIMKANASRSRCVKTSEIDKQIEEDEKLVQELLDKWEAKDSEAEPETELPKELRTAKNRLKALRKAKEVVEKIAEERHLRELKKFDKEEAARLKEHELAQAEALEANRSDGPDLQETRLAAGLSQKELSAQVGMQRARIASFENGTRFPDEKERQKIAKALGHNSISFKKKGPEPRPIKHRATPEKKYPTQTNLTDPESACIARLHKESVQGFNPQYAVDADNQVIVGCYVSNETHDRHNLIPVLSAVLEATSEKPKEVSADSGYFRSDLFVEPILDGIDVYIPPSRKLKEKFKNPCPCAQMMRDKLLSDAGKERKSLRGQTVEPVFGQIKHCKRYRHFLTRGLNTVSTEWTLLAIAHNMMKLFGSRK